MGLHEVSPGIEPKPAQTESSRSSFQLQDQPSTYPASAHLGMDVQASDLPHTRLHDRECHTPADGRPPSLGYGNEEEPGGRP